MKLWQRTFRLGIAPQMSVQALDALYTALLADSPELIAGATVSPPPIAAVTDWPVEAADPIAYCGWKGEQLETVGEVEEFFFRIAVECDRLLGEEAVIRHFLNWLDETPRDEWRTQLLAEVRLALDLANEPAEVA